MVDIETIKIAICLIAKDENDYIEEWINHHKNIGITDFIIYDNFSNIPISNTIHNLNMNDVSITIIDWKNDSFLCQSNAYLDCCQKYKDKFDYIIFIDGDEFIILNTHLTIQEYLNDFISKHGKFNGLGLSWRFYGKPKPYFETKQKAIDYIYYHEDTHIKSILNPKSVIRFPDPHFALIKDGKYVNEHNIPIKSPIVPHSSNDIWIKHIYTRSLSEFKEKMSRLDVNTRRYRITNINDFYVYNDKCILK